MLFQVPNTQANIFCIHSMTAEGEAMGVTPFMGRLSAHMDI